MGFNPPSPAPLARSASPLTLKADRSISSRLRAGESLAMFTRGATSARGDGKERSKTKVSDAVARRAAWSSRPSLGSGGGRP